MFEQKKKLKFITKCEGIITNCDSLVYFKVRSFFITKCDTVYYKFRQVLQSAMNLLQTAPGITKCDDYYKLRQYTLTRRESYQEQDIKCYCDHLNSVF